MIYLVIPAYNPPEDSEWNQKLWWYLVAQTESQNGHIPNISPDWIANITTQTWSFVFNFLNF